MFHYSWSDQECEDSRSRGCTRGEKNAGYNVDTWRIALAFSNIALTLTLAGGTVFPVGFAGAVRLRLNDWIIQQKRNVDNENSSNDIKLENYYHQMLHHPQVWRTYFHSTSTPYSHFKEGWKTITYRRWVTFMRKKIRG